MRVFMAGKLVQRSCQDNSGRIFDLRTNMHFTLKTNPLDYDYLTGARQDVPGHLVFAPHPT